jgi:hypothetical protein
LAEEVGARQTEKALGRYEVMHIHLTLIVMDT